jgi:hypothetical protein
VVIGTPAYGGLVTTRYLHSVMAACYELSRQGVVSQVLFTEGESLIQRARNNICAKFLAMPNASHLIFVDADIEFEGNSILRLLCHDRDVICGVYPKKTYPIDYAFHPRLDGDGNSRRDPVSGAVEIENAATGFLCIKRQVLLRLAEAYPETKYRCPPGSLTAEEEAHLFNYFPVMVEDGILWSEDYGFCRRWRAIGGEVWMDPSITLSHCGQHVFQGDPSRIYGVVG